MARIPPGRPFPRVLLLSVSLTLLAATVILIVTDPFHAAVSGGALALFLIATLDCLLLVFLVERQLRTEAALRGAVKRERALLIGNPDLLLLVGADGVILDARPGPGYDEVVLSDGMEGRVLQEALPPSLAVSVQLAVDAVRGQGQDMTVESGVEAGARMRQCEIRAVPVPGGDVLVIVRDISDRKARERELETAYNFLHGYRRALDETSIVIKLSSDFSIRYVNERFTALSGYGAEELLGRPFAGVSPEGFDEARMAEIRRFLREERVWNGIVECGRRGGERFSVDFFILPVLDEFQRILEIVAVGHDVTALQETLEKARAGERAKAEFVANISHEIRTPLNAIFGFLDLLARSRLDGEQREFVSIVQGGARTLLAVINDVLDFSKIEKGRLLLESIPFQPLRELEIAAEFFSAAAREKGIAYSVFVDPRLPSSLRGDPLRLKQVVSNLLSNAIKFTAAGGAVDLEAGGSRAPGGGFRLAVSVRDTGIGIPHDKRRLIFEAFTQADASVTRRFGGTGLGLAISSHLVRRMGGSLDLESREGAGSRFFFSLELPVEEAAPSLAIAPEAGSVHLCVARGAAAAGGEDGWARNAMRYAESLGLRTDAPGRDGAPCILVSSTEVPSREAGDAAVIEIADGREPSSAQAGRRVLRVRPPLTATKLLQAVLTLLGTAPEVPAGGEAARIRIRARALVAEDHPVNRKLIAYMLDTMGIRVDLAVDGQEAVEKLLERNYDIVLMDVNMPVLDGIEATKIIRNREREGNLSHTPIIALTALVTGEEKRKVLDCGMDGFLPKPVGIEGLTTAVCSALGIDIASVTIPAATADAVSGTTADAVSAATADAVSAVASGLSWEAICRALGVSEAVARKLVQGFLDGVEDDIRALEEAASAGDAPRLARACHKLKGAALSLRLAPVADLAIALETEAKAGTVTGAAAAADRLRAAVRAVGADAARLAPTPPPA